MADNIEYSPTQKDLADVRGKFVETMGVFFQTEGLPRTAGRIVGLLIFDGQPVSFSGLAEGLQVSRGSISTSSRLLLQAGLIQRVSKAGERQDYFQLADKPYEALVSTEIARMNHAQAEISKTLETLPSGNDKTCARLNDLKNFFGATAECLAGVRKAISK